MLDPVLPGVQSHLQIFLLGLQLELPDNEKKIYLSTTEHNIAFKNIGPKTK